jgi:ferritin-like metal-binding protein YciE
VVAVQATDAALVPPPEAEELVQVLPHREEVAGKPVWFLVTQFIQVSAVGLHSYCWYYFAPGIRKTIKLLDMKQTENTSTMMESKKEANGKDEQTSTASKALGKNDANKEKKDSLLEKFFTDQLKDIYYAEQQLVKSIPKMEEAATSEELKEAFNDHLHQTQKHVKRLEKVFSLLGKKPEGKKCEAMDGLIKEAEGIISETKESSMTRDAALIIAAQKIEHYEIATYGGLVQLALTMDLDDISDVLDTTLMEEEQTDYLLTDIAESYINVEAEKEGSRYSWEASQKMEETTS